MPHPRENDLQQARPPLVIRDLNELKGQKETIIMRLTQYSKSDKGHVRDELMKAFQYSLIYVQEKMHQAHMDGSAGLRAFLTVFSDTLHVKREALLLALHECHLEFMTDTLTQDENASLESSDDMPQTDVKDKENLEDMPLHEIPVDQCFIYHLKLNRSVIVFQGKTKKWYLTKCPHGLDFKEMEESMAETFSMHRAHPLKAEIQAKLPDYTISAYLYQHPLYRHWAVSCYPQEKHVKVGFRERFSAKYTLPEKQAKFARPILDLELTALHGPCVRCYLTLAGRPREGRGDKDITQNNKGIISFSNVKLMNFGDPLRALTWVEDYVKNVDEHGGIAEENIILRTFLVSLTEYQRTLTADEFLSVDADRAPGQVRLQGYENCTLLAINHSLVSFMDGEVRSGDGRVKSLRELTDYFFGEPITPIAISQAGYIAHQHGRAVFGEEKRYQGVDVDTPSGHLLEARRIERDLSGFNLEPNSAIKPGSGFLMYGNKPSKSKKGYPASAEKENHHAPAGKPPRRPK